MVESKSFLNLSTIKTIINQFRNIHQVYIFSDVVDNQEIFKNSLIIRSIIRFTLEKGCGQILKDYFSINVEAYIESLRHNSCLNRKIPIDANGNIRSCPSMTKSFGNIKDTTLVEAIEKPGFKKYGCILIKIKSWFVRIANLDISVLIVVLMWKTQKIYCPNL